MGGFALADLSALRGPSAAPAVFFLGFVLLFSTVAGTGITRLLRKDHGREAELESARRQAWGLISEMLPAELAAQLARSPGPVARAHPQATVLFAALMGFTGKSAQISPDVLVRLLDEVFGAFDELCARHGVEKIKTIGDAYMAAAGMQNGDRGAAARVAALALDMHAAVARLRRPDGAPLVLRVGVATGPVVAGQMARLLSELATTGAPLSWGSAGASLCPDEADRDALRRRWDVLLARLRQRLRREGVRPDLVRSTGNGLVELLLHLGDRVVDET